MVDEHKQGLLEGVRGPARRALAGLVAGGVAVLHDGETCRFVAHRAASIPAVVDSLADWDQQGKSAVEEDGDPLERLATVLPRHTLVVPVSREQRRALGGSETLGSAAWNVGQVLPLPTHMAEAETVDAALVRTARQQDMLRTSFAELTAGVWAQLVEPEPTLRTQPLAVDSLPALHRFAEARRRELLDVTTPPWRLWRCRVEGAQWLVVVAHHAVADAFTPALLVEALQSSGTDAAAVGRQYWQYALEQRDPAVARHAASLDWWRGQFEAASSAWPAGSTGGPFDIRLPCDAERPANPPDEAASPPPAGVETVALTSAENAAITRFLATHGYTFTHLFTLAIGLTLTHGLDNPSAVARFLVNQRNEPDLLHTLGDFTAAAFMPYLREQLAPEQSVLEALHATRTTTAQLMRHARADFDAALAMAGLEDLDDDRRLLRDVVINSTDLDAGSGHGSAASTHPSSLTYPADHAPADQAGEHAGEALAAMFFQIIKADGRLRLVASFRADRFGPASRRRLAAVVVKLVTTMAWRPELPLQTLLADVAPDWETLQAAATRGTLSAPSPEHAVMRAPLTEGQLGLWALQQLHPGMTAYNTPIALRIHDALDFTVLTHAFAWLTRARPMLRNAFARDADGAPFQYVEHTRPPVARRHEVADLDEAALLSRLRETLKTPFRLEAEPLARLDVFTRGPREHILLVTAHHLILDGASINHFVRELFDAYEAFGRGEPPPEPPSRPPRFYEFVAWERRYLASEAAARALAYWREQLAGAPPALALPLDKPRPARRAFTGGARSRSVATDLLARTKETARRLNVSLFVLLLSVYAALLQRYAREDEFVVGLPTLGRPEPRFAEALGHFVNVIPWRAVVDETESFSALARRTRRTATQGLDHAQYPFAKLVADLQLQTGEDQAPVFQTLFVLQQAEADGGSRFAPVEGLHQEGDHDLSVEAVLAGDGLTLHAAYDEALFHEATVARFLEHFTTLLEAVLANPELPVGSHPMAPEAQTRQDQWNRTAVDHPQNKLAHQLVKQQARRRPEAPAALFRRRTLTYAQLHRYSLQFAKQLQQQGVTRGVLVGLCMERSLEMIVGVLAIMKAGGVVTPLAAEHPDERLATILETSGAACVVTSRSQRKRLETLTRETACAVSVLDKTWMRPRRVSGRLQGTPLLTDPAYVIHTSGTTGAPKGVVVSHAALLNQCHAARRAYGLTLADRILQNAPLHVDTALEQILPGLTAGATLVLQETAVASAAQFRALLDSAAITVADIPPAYLHELLLAPGGLAEGEPPRHLRLTLCGGEALRPETVRLWRAGPMRAVRLMNAYGPTETTITSLLYEASTPMADDHAPNEQPPNEWPQEEGVVMTTVPVGLPLDNEQAWILDAAGRPCPVGVPGELHIGGAGVAMGYLHDPERTRAKFIPDPFAPSGAEGARLFRTGDLARRRPDGVIEFLGRLDEQVQIRGFRVECGEVEAALTALPEVGQAVVLAAKDADGGARLAAFVTAAEPSAQAGRAPDGKALADALRTRLPAYMIPEVFLEVEAIPLTPAGKTDKRALLRRLPKRQDAPRREGVPVRTATARRLAALWSRLLETDVVHGDDNFFTLGGHSLLAVRLAALVEQAFGTALPLHVILETPTLDEMAQRLDSSTAAGEWGRAPGEPCSGTSRLDAETAPSILAPIVRRGSRPPLFFVHPAGGEVLAYAALAPACKDRPLYGVRTPGLTAPSPRLAHADDEATSVAGLARLYREAVEAVQPRGPYHVGGWSMGGLVAYEMARQWEAAGETTAVVAMLDTYTPAALAMLESTRRTSTGDGAERVPAEGTVEDDALLAMDFVRELGLSGEHALTILKKHHPDVTLAATAFCTHGPCGEDGRPSSLGAHVDEAELAGRFAVYATNVRAMRAYALPPLGTRPPHGLALACAVGEPPWDAAVGWRAQHGEAVLVRRLAGDHFSLLSPPHVSAVQAWLQELLGAA